MVHLPRWVWQQTLVGPRPGDCSSWRPHWVRQGVGRPLLPSTRGGGCCCCPSRPQQRSRHKPTSVDASTISSWWYRSGYQQRFEICNWYFAERKIANNKINEVVRQLGQSHDAKRVFTPFDTVRSIHSYPAFIRYSRRQTCPSASGAPTGSVRSVAYRSFAHKHTHTP